MFSKIFRSLSNLYLFWFFLIVFLGVFVSSLAHPDIDMGWHLRVGQDFFERGIFPRENLYSFGLEPYSWVDNWGSSFLYYLVYNNFGYSSLAFFYAVISFFAFFIPTFLAVKFFRVGKVFACLAFLAAVYFSLDIIGIHAQVVGVFFLALIFLILHYVILAQKWVFLLFLPPIFIFWVNAHGSFPLGLLLLTIYTFSPLILRWPKMKATLNRFFPRLGIDDRFSPLLFLALMVCFLVTFLSPYGLGTWQYSFVHAQNSFLRQFVVEWFPLYKFPILFPFVIFTAFFLVLFWLALSEKKIPFTHFVLIFLFLLATINARRNIPIFLALAMPSLAISLELFFNQTFKKFLAKIPTPSSSFFAVLKIFSLFLFLIPTLHLVGLSKNHILAAKDGFLFDQRFSNFYPSQAANYLNKVDARGNVFNYVNWGGYLLWTHQATKVFIDGRMHVWEEGAVTKKYFKMTAGDQNGYQDFKKLDVQWVVFPSNELRPEEKFASYDFLNKLVFGQTLLELERIKGEGRIKFLGMLEEDSQWQKIYQDQVAVIYKKI